MSIAIGTDIDIKNQFLFCFNTLGVEAKLGVIDIVVKLYIKGFHDFMFLEAMDIADVWHVPYYRGECEDGRFEAINFIASNNGAFLGYQMTVEDTLNFLKEEFRKKVA